MLILHGWLNHPECRLSLAGKMAQFHRTDGSYKPVYTVREVPISEETAKIIKKYLDVMGLQGKLSEPLFSSQRSAKMTTASIRYTVQKYISEAKKSSPGMFLDRGYSPHSFRHSKAIHLLKAGVPLIYIRNFLIFLFHCSRTKLASWRQKNRNPLPSGSERCAHKGFSLIKCLYKYQ